MLRRVIETLQRCAVRYRLAFVGQRASLALVAVILFAGCGKGWLPSERAIYNKACTAIQALPNLPTGATPMPVDQCRLYIGKSAARIDVPVSINGATSETYTLWFKRVARTWEPSSPPYPTSNPPPGAGSIMSPTGDVEAARNPA